MAHGAGATLGGPWTAKRQSSVLRHGPRPGTGQAAGWSRPMAAFRPAGWQRPKLAESRHAALERPAQESAEHFDSSLALLLVYDQMRPWT